MASTSQSADSAAAGLEPPPAERRLFAFLTPEVTSYFIGEHLVSLARDEVTLTDDGPLL
jgi:hypothetical protein